MKIAILVSSLENGGSERVAVALASWLGSAGHETAIITWSSPDSDFYEVPGGVQRVGLNLSGTSKGNISAGIANLTRIISLRKAVCSLKADYLISLGSTANILAIIANMFLSTKVVISDRINPYDAPLAGAWKYLQLIFYRFAHLAIAQSIDAERWLKHHFPKLPTKVIGNAAFMTSNNSSHGIKKSDEPIRLLFVGRLVKQKGVDVLLNALAILEKMHCRAFHCSIVGDGPERHSLENLSSRLGLDHRVTFSGRASNVSDHYSQSDIFVLPSRYEGFPNTLIEAMTMGLPVVASSCGAGVADVFATDYRAGLQFSVDSPAECASAIYELIENKELRNALGTSAIKRSKDYSESIISKHWLDIIV